jgi:hypothetical protein
MVNANVAPVRSALDNQTYVGHLYRNKNEGDPAKWTYESDLFRQVLFRPADGRRCPPGHGRRRRGISLPGAGSARAVRLPQRLEFEVFLGKGGDPPLDGVFTGYRDFGGVLFPSRIV